MNSDFKFILGIFLVVLFLISIFTLFVIVVPWIQGAGQWSNYQAQCYFFDLHCHKIGK